MPIAYFLSLAVAVIIILWMWRFEYAQSSYAYQFYIAAAGLVGLAVYTLIRPDGSQWVQFAGLMIVWGAVLWQMWDDSSPIWMGSLLVGALLLFLVLPIETLNLLKWSLPLTLPLISHIHLQKRAVDFHFLPPSALPTATRTAPPSKVGQITDEMLETHTPVLECLDEGVVVSDPEGNIKFVNSAAASIIELPVEEIIGLYVMDVLSRLPMLDVLGPSGSRELMQFEMNGRLIQGRLDVVFSTDGEFQGSVAILHDITASYQSQRAKEAFLTTVSHELRTPLTAIKGYVELFGSDIAGPLNDNQKLFLDTIRRNVERMAQLIDSLIFVSAVRGGRLQTQPSYADLRQLIQQIVREMEPVLKRSQQTMQVNIDPKIEPIQADAIHISTVLQELIDNSIKYNVAGGKIQIDVFLEPGEQVEQEFVVVRVSDEGIGIQPADQHYIFDDFYRSDTDDVSVRAGGMGVGLAIVRALIEAYNGRIWFDSNPGQGSAFTFVLPTKQADDSTVQQMSEISQ